MRVSRTDLYVHVAATTNYSHTHTHTKKSQNFQLQLYKCTCLEKSAINFFAETQCEYMTKSYMYLYYILHLLNAIYLNVFCLSVWVTDVTSLVSLSDRFTLLQFLIQALKKTSKCVLPNKQVEVVKIRNFPLRICFNLK